MRGAGTIRIWRPRPIKHDKKNVPEDAFYHLFEMNLDGSGLRQLTRGKYDDFDGRYLPDGRIVFLSTRRGAWLQVTPETARRSLERADEPDCYVRCGGGPQRPVAVYTLHTIDADGGNLNPISPFEMFEWTPSVAADGTILYSRWDYIDRDNGPYMSMWSMNPDGTNARLVYKNFTKVPHCAFEPQSVPGSSKILFTASGHHSQTMGSLVMLDPAAGTEGAAPITRLTPEVVFPEIEGWSGHYFTNPQPLSERMILVCWGQEETVREGTLRSANAMGLYVFDAVTGNLELLYRDPQITLRHAIAVQNAAAAAGAGQYGGLERAAGRANVADGCVSGAQDGPARRHQGPADRGGGAQDASDDGLSESGDDPRGNGQGGAGDGAGGSGWLGVFPRAGGCDRVLSGAGWAGDGGADDAERNLCAAGADAKLRGVPRVADRVAPAKAGDGVAAGGVEDCCRAGGVVAVPV